MTIFSSAPATAALSKTIIMIAILIFIALLRSRLLKSIGSLELLEGRCVVSRSVAVMSVGGRRRALRRLALGLKELAVRRRVDARRRRFHRAAPLAAVAKDELRDQRLQLARLRRERLRRRGKLLGLRSGRLHDLVHLRDRA